MPPRPVPEKARPVTRVLARAAVATGADDAAAAKRPRREALTLICDGCSVKARPDGSNWAARTLNEREQQVPQGAFCEDCESFAKCTVHGTPAEVQKAAKRNVTETRALEKDRAEYMESAAHPESRSFDPESLDYVVVSGSRLEERFPFMAKGVFYKERGMNPEDAKLLVTKATNRHGDDVHGIVLAPTKLPELVCWTEKQWIRSKPDLRPDDLMFSRHLATHYDDKIKKFQRNFGQEPAGKYIPKTKPPKAYTQDEIEQAVELTLRSGEAKAQASRSGLAALGGSSSASARAASRAASEKDTMLELEDRRQEDLETAEQKQDDEDEIDEGEGGVVEVLEEGMLTPGGSAAPSSPGAASTSTRGGRREASGGGPRSWRGGRGRSESRSNRQGALASSGSLQVDGRSRSPPATHRAGNHDDAPSMIDDTDKKHRRKSASYWLTVLSEDAALSGRTFLRELEWADGCVDRHVRTGSGMMPEAFIKLAASS